MRKYSTKRDANGIVRLELNNQPLFQFWPLDQGWWPDGLYTAPTDEALVYDIQKTKDLGFNMIRKQDVYKRQWLNRLNLRMTYGVGGNVPKNAGPYMTVVDLSLIHI